MRRPIPMMLDLLRWHGAEEVEHRSLVYDVYQHVCGSYTIRAFSMLMTAPLFIGWWVAGARYLMAHDPTIDRQVALAGLVPGGPRLPTSGSVETPGDDALAVYATQPPPK